MNNLHRSPVLTTFAPSPIRSQAFNNIKHSSSSYSSKSQDKSQTKKEAFPREEPSIDNSTTSKSQQESTAKRTEDPYENQENINPATAKKLMLQNQSEPQAKGLEGNHSSHEVRVTSTKISKTRAKKAKQLCIGDFLHISKAQIDFGAHAPGEIWEETLEITNRSNHDLLVQIEVDCFNSELQETDEYIYSLRRNFEQDYNDRHFVMMTGLSTVSFKIALNVPLMKLQEDVMGEARIFVQGLAGMYRVGMRANIMLPRVICPQELYHVESKCKLVKLCVKRGNKQETKIPLKNVSKVPVVLELEFYNPKQVAMMRKYGCIVYPNVITLLPEATGFVTLYVRNINPEREQEQGDKKDQGIEVIKEILVGRVVNSAVFYSFALSIELY